jgi:hypothetical protein
MLALPGLTLTNNVPDKVSFKEAVAVTCNCQGLAHHPHNTDKTDGLTLVATLPFSGVPTTGALGILLLFSVRYLLKQRTIPPISFAP